MQRKHCITGSIIESREVYDSRKQIDNHNVQIFYRKSCRSHWVSYYILPVNHSVS